MKCKNCNGTGKLRIPIDFRGPDCPAIVDCHVCKSDTDEIDINEKATFLL